LAFYLFNDEKCGKNAAVSNKVRKKKNIEKKSETETNRARKKSTSARRGR